MSPVGVDADDAGVVDPAAGQDCDPDTGICGPTQVAGQGGGSDFGGVAIGPITPVTLDQGSGWGSTQALIVVVTLLTLGLVLAPAAAWRYFSQRRPS